MSNLRRALRLVLAVALLVVGLTRLAPRAGTAAAAVSQGVGFRATVDGFSSWYGSYLMGGLSTAWCIDHGIRAPDPDLGYVPTGLESVPEPTRVALAWAMGRHGPGADAVGAAALMLVAHDLMGAMYPSGRLDVNTLGTGSMSGFGASAADVLARARAIKADALAHAGLRPPWRIELTSVEPVPASLGAATVRVTAGGVPVAGVDVRFGASPGTVVGSATGRTGADGTAAFMYDPPASPYRLTAAADVPDLVVQAFAPTAAPAQRVARPATTQLATAVDRQAPRFPPQPTTTTTRPPSTTTTRPPVVTTTRPPATTVTTRPPAATTTTARPVVTTSTTRPPAATTSTTRPVATTSTTRPPTVTTTTRPPTATTATIRPPTVTTATIRPPGATSTTAPDATTSTTGPPGSTTAPPVPPPPTTPPTPPPPPPPPGPSLPRTGFDPVSLAATGSGLVLLGSALRSRTKRGRRPTPA